MKVLLFGCGVEEQFGGHYSQLIQVKIKNFSRYTKFIPLHLKKLMYSLATMSNIPADRLYYVYKILFGPDQYDSQSGYFNDVLDKLMNAPYDIDRAEQIRNKYRELAKTHNMDLLTSWLFLDFSIKIPDDLMPGVERMSMAASIETRMPFLDHRLVEFTSRIPDKFKIKTDGEQKYIWKKVAEKILPKEIIYQEKLPFLVPFEQWLNEDKMKKLVYKIIFEDTKDEFFNLSFAEKLFNHTIENKRSYAELIWRMFFFKMWYKKWIENEEISF